MTRVARRNNRARQHAQPPTLIGVQSTERDPDGVDWHIRTIPAQRAGKTYWCPGCDHSIPPGTNHVVAWQPDDCAGRRHWHSPCWRARHRRRPTRRRT